MLRLHRRSGRAQRPSQSDYRLRRTPLPCATTRAQIGLAPAFQPYAITLRRTIGTDGVRGTANVEPMTSETALRLGRALAYVSKRSHRRHKILIGKDTRLSGYMLETATASRPARKPVEDLPPSFTVLREWRLKRAKADGVPAYVVFTDATLVALAERKPANPPELLAIAGIGPRKLGQYGAAVFALVAGETPDDLAQKNFEN